MVRADAITTAGAVLAVVISKAPLASAIDPAAHMMRALATTSTSSSECPAEAQACLADASCLACAEAFPAAFEACTLAEYDTCDELVDIVCCASSGCEANALFGEYMGARCRMNHRPGEKTPT